MLHVVGWFFAVTCGTCVTCVTSLQVVSYFFAALWSFVASILGCCTISFKQNPPRIFACITMALAMIGMGRGLSLLIINVAGTNVSLFSTNGDAQRLATGLMTLGAGCGAAFFSVLAFCLPSGDSARLNQPGVQGSEFVPTGGVVSAPTAYSSAAPTYPSAAPTYPGATYPSAAPTYPGATTVPMAYATPVDGTVPMATAVGAYPPAYACGTSMEKCDQGYSSNC